MKKRSAVLPWAAWVVAGAVLAGAAGCGGGPKRAAVSGKVLVDHEPLKEGSIDFIPVKGTPGPSAGGIIHNGEYHILSQRGAAVGKNKVVIKGFRNTGRKVPDPWTKEEKEERLMVIPQEYGEQSTQFRDIEDQDNRVDFDVPGVKPEP